jgi:AcrR family transcriptional regulator
MSDGGERAAAVRNAMVEVVGQLGLHGASMSVIARHAGVATGTAYTYYRSKDELLLSAYVEVKQHLAAAAMQGLRDGWTAQRRFQRIWDNTLAHLTVHRGAARFLVQLDGSPLASEAHAAAAASGDDPLLAETRRPATRRLLIDVPPEVLYDLALGPAVRLAARGLDVSTTQHRRVAAACWRAITRPS